MIVTGLNNFRILGGTYNTTTNRTSFDLIFPEVQLLGEYGLDAWAVMAGFPTSMAGNGLLNLKLIDYRLVGEFAVTPVSYGDEQGMRISDFNLHFYFGDVVYNNWNTLWDISANNFVNRWAREFTLMWAQQIQAQVDDIYAQLLLPNINGILSNISMTSLIDYFVQQSMEFNMMQCTLT